MDKIILSYCRVSTTEQSTDGAGLENQQYANNQAIERLQKLERYKRLDDIVEIGSAFKGNNLTSIIENAKAGTYPKGSMIVMFDQTRFSRTNFLDSANRMKELLDTGVNIHFSTSNETITSEKLVDFGGFVSMLAKAEAANKESKSRSDRTLTSYANKIAKGEIVAVGKLPNWIRKNYDTSGSKPRIVGFEIIPDRKEVLEAIFDKYINGEGATSITAWLNKNVEPWPEFDHKRKDKANRVWRESYVTKILVNPAAIGVDFP
ncbi:MAG TPA: recombinase family protein [Rheinheimera sp.]|uniref:recombinase family protein n=1 Tax=Rheinheimera sp. TaxID=1869214 RepID=UPI002F924BF2